MTSRRVTSDPTHDIDERSIRSLKGEFFKRNVRGFRYMREELEFVAQTCLF